MPLSFHTFISSPPPVQLEQLKNLVVIFLSYLGNYVYIGGLNDWWTSLGWKSVMRTSKGERKKAKLAALLSEMILTTSCIQQTAATLFWRLWLESILMLVSGGEEEWCLVCMMSDNQTYTPQRYWCGLLGCIYYGVYSGRGFYSLRLNIIKV